MQLKNTETTGGSRVLKEYGKKTSLGQSIKKKIQKICYSHTHTQKKKSLKRFHIFTMKQISVKLFIVAQKQKSPTFYDISWTE